MVLWRDLDYLADARGMDQASLDEALIETRNHLALVFHRYLDGEHGRPFFYRNQRETSRKDRSLSEGSSSDPSRAGRIVLRRRTGSHCAPVHVAIHHKKLTETDRRRAGITTTLRESQGFYIYRQMRLVIWGGTWFSILPKQDVGRLARVLVDVPNTLDHLWALDIKKSPPPSHHPRSSASCGGLSTASSSRAARRTRIGGPCSFGRSTDACLDTHRRARRLSILDQS